jgi:hypothetical protein
VAHPKAVFLIKELLEPLLDGICLKQGVSESEAL